MDAKAQEILQDFPEIDEIAVILIKSLHRAAVEKRHGYVEISIPVHAGQLRQPKEKLVITHNL